MKSLNDNECLNWIASHEPGAKSFSSPADIFSNIPFKGYYDNWFPFPKDSGRKVALARLIFHQMNVQSGDEVLVWIRNWIVWPSSSHLPLVTTWRKGLGCQQSLEEEPGHLFGGDEVDDAMSLLVISLQFFYDCLVFHSERRLICFVSHDEVVALMSTDESLLNKISEFVKT